MRLVSRFALLAISTVMFFCQVRSGFSEESVIPRFVQFSGVLEARSGDIQPGLQSITFALYRDQRGGAPLWQETQNVTVDADGRYTVLLGAGTRGGVPLELFASGESRWLGLQVNGSDPREEARVLLVSVPYALKAGDADTLGGKPASAFMPALTVDNGDSSRQPAVQQGLNGLVGGTGTTNMVTKWDSNGVDIKDSAIFENGGNVGIGTTTPATKLHLLSNNGGDANATFENLAPGVASYLTIKANSPFAAGIFQTSTDKWAFGRFGGANEFAIKDITATELSPFVIQAGAPNNAFYITG